MRTRFVVIATAATSLLAAAFPAHASTGHTGRFTVSVEGTYEANGTVTGSDCGAAGSATEEATFRSSKPITVQIAKASKRFPLEIKHSDTVSGFRPLTMLTTIERSSDLADGSTPRACFPDTPAADSDCGTKTARLGGRPRASGTARPTIGFVFDDLRTEFEATDPFEACRLPTGMVSFVGNTPDELEVNVTRLFKGARRSVLRGTTKRTATTRDGDATVRTTYTYRWQVTLIRKSSRTIR